MLQLCVLAFSVLDNHSTRAFPHFEMSYSAVGVQLCHQCTREMVEGVNAKRMHLFGAHEWGL